MIVAPQRRRLGMPPRGLQPPLDSGGMESSEDGMAGPDSAPESQPRAGVTGGPARFKPRPATGIPGHLADASARQGLQPPPIDGSPAGEAMAITALPDGNGGAVTVPPTAVAPSGGGLVPKPADTTPWSAVAPSQLGGVGAGLTGSPAGGAGAVTAPAAPAAPPWQSGVFDMGHNAINRVIEPGDDEPSRIDLATKYGEIFDEATRGAYNRDRVDATNDAAEHGRVGSGMLTNRYGDLFEERQRQKDALKATLLTNATEGTIADRRSNRAEQRTERGYQSGKAAEALAARIQQNAAESSSAQQALDNAIRTYGLGAASDPSNALLGASGRASGESGAAASGVQELLKYLMQMRGTQAVAGG